MTNSWYDSLDKSPLTPPPIVFQIVWPVLYVLMAISFIRYLRRGGKALGTGIFIFQLVLNGLWVYLFFSLSSPLFAMIDLIVLFVAVTTTTYLFWKVDPVAGILLLPYLLWLSFALYLNGYLLRSIGQSQHR